MAAAEVLPAEAEAGCEALRGADAADLVLLLRAPDAAECAAFAVLAAVERPAALRLPVPDRALPESGAALAAVFSGTSKPSCPATGAASVVAGAGPALSFVFAPAAAAEGESPLARDPRSTQPAKQPTR